MNPPAITTTTVAASGPRAGRPSASAFHRLRACPGSFHASIGEPERPTPWSESGTDIHAALCGQPATITPEQQDVADTCKTLVDRACAAAGYGSLQSATRIHREQRLWIEDSWSGQFDLLIQWGGRCLLIDFKTGRADNPEPADNEQLRALVALVYANYFPREITVAIIQPWVSPQIPPLAIYKNDDLEHAVKYSMDLVDAADKPAAPRRTGDHCRYCPALGGSRCPESRALVAEVAAVSAVDALDGPQLARFLEISTIAEHAIEAGRARAKFLLDVDPNAVPGWTLKPGVERETIADVRKVFGRAVNAGVPAELFSAQCTISKKAVKDLLRGAKGLKGAALDALVADTLEGCTVSKTTARSLARAD